MDLLEAISQTERAVYEQRARAIIYPDLRSAYVEDRAMIAKLANTLADLDRLAARGGGELPVLRVRGGRIESFISKRQPVAAIVPQG